MSSNDISGKEGKILKIAKQLRELPIGEINRLEDIIKKRVEFWDGVIKEAPALYRKRPADQHVTEFIEEHYYRPGHLNGKFGTAHLDVLDPELSKRISGDARRNGWPEHLAMPSRNAEVSDPTRKIEASSVEIDDTKKQKTNHRE